MGVGLEVYNEDGVMVYNSATRPTVMLGSFTATTTNGFIDVDERVTQDNFWVIIRKFNSSISNEAGYRIPKFYVQDNKIHWSYDMSYTTGVFLETFSAYSTMECVYGVYL